MSQHDRLNQLREKMREYLAQGAQLGWLINPQDKTVEVFRAGGDAEKHEGIDRLEAEGPVAGFVLDLTYVWNPLAEKKFLQESFETIRFKWMKKHGPEMICMIAPDLMDTNILIYSHQDSDEEAPTSTEARE